jgi:hypothetical protein
MQDTNPSFRLSVGFYLFKRPAENIESVLQPDRRRGGDDHRGGTPQVRPAAKWHTLSFI